MSLLAMKFVGMAFAVMICSVSQAAVPGKQCGEPPEKETMSLFPALGYNVAGSGRLYFHAAPNLNCRIDNLFVIPGDLLVAHEQFGEWSYVVFVPKNQNKKEVSGWVESKRLKFIGTMGNTDEKDFPFYENAQKAAEKGKLGSPFSK
ncbi:hypothetical protein H8K35_08295 [Undibacterium sp. LX40W]|uniref:SH3 domain-containing protein n=1 Tax=Undibacterium nitidum TaxID=2762298 RepID=A0A923KSU0_9BURK|nr:MULTISPECIES: hypothetical protein [Undibacterium]MBC3881566.1 hypothetical protein [Undibacterium nitidum]MBC3891652.1 hypothetical protein [Undibacterium sp. LX40W]